jgi:hypothetical protein
MDDTTPPSTAVRLCRTRTQELLFLLAREPDLPQIPIPRRWLAAWYASLLHVIALLEQHHSPHRGASERPVTHREGVQE